MYGIFTYIYHRNQPNAGKYTIHGWYGKVGTDFNSSIRLGENRHESEWVLVGF